MPGHWRTAHFATAVSVQSRKVRSWGFWWGAACTPLPIGPRHTYLDGAACAFDALDGIWSFGDPLVQLLDIYALWAFRHLHLEQIGTWPGPQAARLDFERIVELKAGEHCGCDSPRGTYGECCAESDSQRDKVAAHVAYWRFFGMRKPPPSVTTFALNGGEPPDMKTLFPLTPYS